MDQMIFKKQQGRIRDDGKALNDKNMPPVSGQLRFAQEIRTKVKSGMKNFIELNHPVQTSKAGEEARLQEGDDDRVPHLQHGAPGGPGHALVRCLCVERVPEFRLR